MQQKEHDRRRRVEREDRLADEKAERVRELEQTQKEAIAEDAATAQLEIPAKLAEQKVKTAGALEKEKMETFVKLQKVHSLLWMTSSVGKGRFDAQRDIASFLNKPLTSMFGEDAATGGPLKGALGLAASKL